MKHMVGQVGQVGLGFVGGALHKSFKIREVETVIYDKYKEIGNIKDLVSCRMVFLCLPTPYVANHGFDIGALLETCKKLRDSHYSGIILIKSTVEPGVTKKLSEMFPTMRFCHNPEFLTARSAFEDFDNQKHIVIGSANLTEYDLDTIVNLYTKLYPSAEISVCTSEESESMKLFVNNFYAMKVQIFNEFYLLCQKTGADYQTVKELMFKNGWINPMHTDVPGHDGQPSYGGACIDPEANLISESGEIIKAKDIKIGDKVFDGNSFTRVTKVGDRIVNSSIVIKSRGRILRASKDHIHMIYNNASLEERLFCDINLKDKIYIPKIRINNSNVINVGKKPKIKGLSKWHSEVEITPDISRLFGLYVSSRNSNMHKDKKTNTICWTFKENEECLADEVVKYLGNLGISAKKIFKENKNNVFGGSKVWQVRKKSLWLHALFAKAGLSDDTYYKDTLLFNNDNAKAFISGWLDRDGHFDGSNDSILGFSLNKELIKKIDTMLLSLGVHAFITKNGQQINISKKDDVKKVLAWCKNESFKELPIHKLSYMWSSINSEEYNDGWTSEINSIEEIEEMYKVVSIETESKLYVANNMLTHNCFPKDTNALCHLMKVLGSPHKVLEATIQERNEMREEKWK